MEWVALIFAGALLYGLGRLVGWWALVLPVALGVWIATSADLEDDLPVIVGLIVALATGAAAAAGALGRTYARRRRTGRDTV